MEKRTLTQEQLRRYNKWRKKKRLIRRLKKLAPGLAVLALGVIVLIIAIKVFNSDENKENPPIPQVEEEEEFSFGAKPYVWASDGEYIILKVVNDGEDVKNINVRTEPRVHKGNSVGTLEVGSTFVVSALYESPGHEGFVGVISGEVGLPRQDLVWISRGYLRKEIHDEPWHVKETEYTYSVKYDGPAVITVEMGNVRSEPSTVNADNIYGMVSQLVFEAQKVYRSSDQRWFGFLATDLKDQYLGAELQKDPDGVVWIFGDTVVVSPK